MTTPAAKSARLARLLAIVLTIDMMQNLISPALWILGASNSVVFTVSRLATWPDGIAYTWLALAALILPYAFNLFVGAVCVRCTRFACLGLCAGGVLWFFLAWLARDLDYPMLPFLFGFNGGISIAMGAVLANSINDGQRLAAGVTQ